MNADMKVVGAICDRIDSILEKHGDSIIDACNDKGKLNLSIGIKITDKGGLPKVVIKLKGVTDAIEDTSEGIVTFNV